MNMSQVTAGMQHPCTSPALDGIQAPPWVTQQTGVRCKTCCENMQMRMLKSKQMCVVPHASSDWPVPTLVVHIRHQPQACCRLGSPSLQGKSPKSEVLDISIVPFDRLNLYAWCSTLWHASREADDQCCQWQSAGKTASWNVHTSQQHQPTVAYNVQQRAA